MSIQYFLGACETRDRRSRRQAASEMADDDRVLQIRLLRSQDIHIYITLNATIRREPLFDSCAILIARYATRVAYIVL